MTLRTLYTLTKPGIVYGNVFTAAGGFILGAHGLLPLGTAIATVAGLALIIACGCVLNNYIDRGIDAKMQRTKKRALPQGDIRAAAALAYAMCLGAAGSLLLAVYTNILTLLVALGGLFAYVVIYGIAKRTTVHGTIIGSIAGAVPPVVGYAGATGRLDGAALILFLILVCWQMPHFYAIAMFRRADYAAASLPVLPVVRGMKAAKRQIMIYSVLFLAAVAALAVFGYAGYSYLIIMGSVGIYWVWRGARGFRTADDVRWARGMFFASLVVLPALPIALLANVWLP